jgi:virginiamycin B lyase
MTMPTAPAPRPLCAAFAPLLPLISSGALEDNEARPAHEHVAECAWCRQELARYVEVDEALRRGFGATRENILPYPFDLDGDDEDYAFILEDSMMNGEQDDNPTVTRLSPRWNVRRRALSPRATAIAGIAAALILAVVTTTIYTQFAAWRTTSPSAISTAGSAFAKVITAPNASGGLTITSDGSLWFTEYADLHSKVGRLSPDGKLTEFPVPSPDRAKHAGVGVMTLGPDGNLWFGFTVSTDQGYLSLNSSIIRMTSDGAMTTFPLRPHVPAYRLIVGPDKALWFSEGNKLGRMTTGGQFMEYPVLVPESAPGNGQISDLCVGPDGALWYTWFLSNHIGRMTLDGKAQNFAVPYQASAITSGPDGALWYSQSEPSTTDPAGSVLRAGFVGHLTSAGVASEVPITPSLQASDLIKGPDGAMWFSATDRTDSTLKLGRLSASGDVKVYSTKEYGTGGLLAAAPGAIWMLNRGNSTLWRYRLPA